MIGEIEFGNARDTRSAMQPASTQRMLVGTTEIEQVFSAA
jgi:hypothetical protein